MLRSNKGRLLLELAFVLSALLVITSILFINAKGRVEKARNDVSKSKLHLLASLYREYYLKHGQWPTESSQLSQHILFDDNEELHVMPYEGYINFSLGDQQETAYAVF